MKTLRELLTEMCVNSGYDATDESLEETLRECSEIVHTGPSDSHRWYDVYDVVGKLTDGGKDRFFEFSSCSAAGDNSWEDAGYCFEGIDNVPEVYPKETTAITYVYEPTLKG
jgi:hypothetical protein